MVLCLLAAQQPPLKEMKEVLELQRGGDSDGARRQSAALAVQGRGEFRVLGAILSVWRGFEMGFGDQVAPEVRGALAGMATTTPDLATHLWFGVSDLLLAAADGGGLSDRAPPTWSLILAVPGVLARIRSAEGHLIESSNTSDFRGDSKALLVLVRLCRGRVASDRCLEELWPLLDEARVLGPEIKFFYLNLAFPKLSARDDLATRASAVALALRAQYPKSRLLGLTAAKVAYAAGDKDDALSGFSSLTAPMQTPDVSFLEASYYLGVLAQDAGDFLLAKQYFLAASRVTPGVPPYVLPWTRLRLAACLIELGDREEAARLLALVLRGPNVNDARTEAGELQRRLRRK